MRWVVLLVMLTLAACNTPTPQFYGVLPVEVQVGGGSYRVFRDGDRAQAIRTNMELRPNVRAEERIIDAIQIATGCEVVGKLKGDVALANARIDCGAGARPWPKEVSIRLSCEASIVSEDYFTCESY